jgi:hypothetical protein
MKKKPAHSDPDPGPRLVPVRDELADAVHALGATAVFLDRIEDFGEEAAFQEGEILEGAHDLARGVVLRGFNGGDAPSAAEVRASASAQLEVLRDLAEESASLLPASLEDVSTDDLGVVSALLREAGLEHMELDVMLATERERGLVLTGVPVTTAQAHVWLLEPLYEWLEGWVAGDPLLTLERAAARWYFERWTPAGRRRDHEFARGVREQEFSLVDRPFLGLGDLTALEAMQEEGELDELPDRQRALAHGLMRSVAGVWEVRSREGEEVVAASPLDGATYRVCEHAPDTHYGPGALLLGRLIPRRGGSWLRSPGALVVPDPAPGTAEALARVLDPEAGDLPDAILVEAMITGMTAGTELPRPVAPAPGPREAAEVLQLLPPLLLDAGIAQEIEVDDLPPEVDRSRLPEGPFYDYELDPVMAEWIGALGEMAAGASAAGEKEKRKGGAKAKKSGAKPRKKR